MKSFCAVVLYAGLAAAWVDNTLEEVLQAPTTEILNCQQSGITGKNICLVKGVLCHSSTGCGTMSDMMEAADMCFNDAHWCSSNAGGGGDSCVGLLTAYGTDNWSSGACTAMQILEDYSGSKPSMFLAVPDAYMTFSGYPYAACHC